MNIKERLAIDSEVNFIMDMCLILYQKGEDNEEPGDEFDKIMDMCYEIFKKGYIAGWNDIRRASKKIIKKKP